MLNLTKVGAPKDLLQGYAAPTQGVHDEAFDHTGAPKPHWHDMLQWVEQTGRDGLREASLDLDRLRTESGIAFAANAPGTEGYGSDPLPVVLTGKDWARLAAGIEQRASLAEAAIADTYTQTRTISAGLIPPGLVYGGPAFGAHCAGWERPPRHWLHIYEANVARTAAGEWIILSDRLDAPLGDGWLLANRIAFAQALSEPFMDIGVRRLASHYAGFQAHLDQMMGWDGRLALLTAGENDPRFFSHAYFARYMNAALVEPADIAVRGGSAFVKTLDGLKRIDVLLRGVPDRRVDALHRPGLAAFGAPALSLAARSGSLKIANAIGSAVFARRALAPFAHRLSTFLLGEDLLLRDAPCLWLGSPRAREQVINERADWRIQSMTSFDETEDVPQDDESLAGHLARIGERLCAVQTPPLAQTPVFTGEGVTAAPWMMRVFACRTGDGWSVVPAAVATSLQPGVHQGSLGFGKDVWVRQDDAQAPLQAASRVMDEQFSVAHTRRTGRDLLSRVADEVYWLGRNAERAEGVLRTLDVCLTRHLDGNRVDADPEVLSILIEAHVKGDKDLDWPERHRAGLLSLVRDPEKAGSVPAILQVLKSGAMRARASISGESWRYIDRLCSDRRWQTGGQVRQSAGLARMITDALQSLAAFAGSAQENLTRNYAWRFLEIGRRLERGIQIALQAERLAGPVRENEETYLRAWLSLSDSTSAYRSRYMMTARTTPVIDLLVLDETNPRSLAFQLAALERVLSEMPTDIPYRRSEHRRALALLTDLRLCDADVLAKSKDGKTRAALAELAKRAKADLSEVSDLISRSFFAHSDAPEALAAQGRQEPLVQQDRLP
ncbi:MAG: circularly permuted type 2 ATP-grasp protein [Pseudomonadota bacterium]